MKRNKLTGKAKRKAIFHDWKNTLLEVGKWVLVIWLLLPLRFSTGGSFDLVRILGGIALFIIFSGKMLYDVLIEDYVKQRRTTVKQDIVAFLGIVGGIVFIVAVVVFMLSIYLGKVSEGLGGPG